MPRWNYSGDMNLEYGGLFWREDGADDYVLAVKVTPCSDAGGPDNLFHIEHGSIYLGTDVKRHKSALDCCGYKLADDGTMTDGAGGTFTKKQARARLVEAMDAYCGLDNRTEHVVQIGKAEPEDGRGGWSPEPDTILRGNAKLRNFVREEFLVGR